MKHGDLVRVFYRDVHVNAGPDEWDGPYHGFICVTPSDHADAAWQMWCIERNTFHILRLHSDKIEVISES